MCENPTESIITMVSQQKKNCFRYNIFIDGEYAFSVHQDILVKYRLTKGRTLEKAQIEELLAAEERNRAEQYAYTYLNYRPRTTAQLKTYLLEKGFTEEDSEAVIELCKDKGYLNDQDYAEKWMEERIRLKPRGRLLLRQELLLRGIDDQTIQDKLEMVVTQETELEMINELIQKRLSRIQYSNPQELKKKVIPYLQRKGFSLELILQAIRQLKL